MYSVYSENSNNFRFLFLPFSATNADNRRFPYQWHFSPFLLFENNLLKPPTHPLPAAKNPFGIQKSTPFAKGLPNRNQKRRLKDLAIREPIVAASFLYNETDNAAPDRYRFLFPKISAVHLFLSLL